MEDGYICYNIKLGLAELFVITGFPFKFEATQAFCFDKIANYKNHLSRLGYKLPQNLTNRKAINCQNIEIHLPENSNKEVQFDYAIDSVINGTESKFLFLFGESREILDQIGLYFRTFNSLALHYNKDLKLYYYFDKSCIGAVMDWFEDFYIKRNHANVDQIEIFPNPFNRCVRCETTRGYGFFTIWICREICDFCAINSGPDVCPNCSLSLGTTEFGYINSHQICIDCGKIEAIEKPRQDHCKEHRKKKFPS
ncbi:unnamed protein product [Blepharisma stoltei]|uniref:Uncharacterized protein n=1 Tax=Blepharisma stoltei TaxID=1481888 RepID=A0AAU9K7M5_9CILI|nr:unnamed protein product [Blepharisma stoltei]